MFLGRLFDSTWGGFGFGLGLLGGVGFGFGGFSGATVTRAVSVADTTGPDGVVPDAVAVLSNDAVTLGFVHE